MGGRTFECLDAVINRYRKEQIVEGHTLGQPVSIYVYFISKMKIINLLKYANNEYIATVF